MLLYGYLREGDRVVTTELEHNSVLRPLHDLQQCRKVESTYVRFDAATGLIDLQQLETELKSRPTRLVVLNHASNVTGIVQPVADVAAATRVSGGLIHYHFATKDVLLTEMLRHEAERDIAKARRLATGSGSTLQRLDRVMREFVPGSRNDQTWVLWIDAWGASLRDETLRTISQELDTAWNEMLFVVISDGVASGDFITDDPRAVADRLLALLDGLGLRVTLQRPGINRKQMHEHARVVAESQPEAALVPGVRVAPRRELVGPHSIMLRPA